MTFGLAKLPATKGLAPALVSGEVSALLFGGGDAQAISAAALDALAREIPFVEHEPRAPEHDPSAAPAIDALELAVLTNLVKSKGEARRLLQQGGLSANGARLASPVIARDQLLRGEYVLLRKGGRSYALARITR